MVTKRKVFVDIRPYESTTDTKTTKPSYVILPIKICPFYLPYTIKIVHLYGDCILLHVHCFSLHINTTRSLPNIDISQPITIINDLITYAPYHLDQTKPTFYSILTSFIHTYDNNLFMILTGIHHYHVPPSKITKPRNTRNYRSIYANYTEYPPILYPSKQFHPNSEQTRHQYITTTTKLHL